MSRQDRRRGTRSGGASAWIAPVLGVLVAGGLIAFVGRSMLQHDRIATQQALDKASIQHAVDAARGDYASAFVFNNAQGLSEFQTYALAVQDITLKAQQLQAQNEWAGGR